MKKLLLIWNSTTAKPADVDTLARLIKDKAPGGDVVVVEIAENWHGIAGNAAAKEALHKLKVAMANELNEKEAANA